MTLTIPESTSGAKFSVRAFNTSDATVPTAAFLAPVLPNRERLPAPVFCFLLTHSKSQKRYMFDLGIKKDAENSAPPVAEMIKNGTLQFPVEKDVLQLLEEQGVDKGSVSQVIWSHAHIDHIGDMSKFPHSVDLVVGEETQLRTYPSDPNATLLESDLANRNVHVVSFKSSNLDIGNYKAIDYLGDGSIYLLDAPGHIAGNMAALVRTSIADSTGAKDSFVLLGGDTAHHPGLLRPTKSLLNLYPCPGDIVELAKSTVDGQYFQPSTLPFDLTRRLTPMLEIPEGHSVHENPADAEISLKKLSSSFDGDERVFIVLAHDAALLDICEKQGTELSSWRDQGFKERIVWKFFEKGFGGDLFSPGHPATL